MSDRSSADKWAASPADIYVAGVLEPVLFHILLRRAVVLGLYEKFYQRLRKQEAN